MSKRTTETTGPLSIQGEAQRRRAETLWATPTEVALYCQGQPDGVVACRESGRHDYPATRKALTDPDAPPFVDITPEGWYVREIPCERCRHEPAEDGTPGAPRVIRREHWHLIHNKRGIITGDGAQLVNARPVIVDPDYVNPPGQGRIKPRLVRAAVMSARLRGLNINTLTQDIRDRKEQRDRLVREAYERSVRAAEREAARSTPAGLSIVPDQGTA